MPRQAQFGGWVYRGQPMPAPTINPFGGAPPRPFTPSPPANLPANFPPELIPQFVGGRVPPEGFARIPSYGGRQTGGQYIAPSEAAWNALKWKLPLGPVYADRPTFGTWQTDPGLQALKRVPLIGGPLAARAYAQREPVQWNPPMGTGERVWETFKNLLGYAGLVSRPEAVVSRGIDVATGIGSLFRPPAPYQDRTGVYGAMMREPYDPGGLAGWDAPQGMQWTSPSVWAQPTPTPPSPTGLPMDVAGGGLVPSPTEFGAPWDPWRGEEFQGP